MQLDCQGDMGLLSSNIYFCTYWIVPKPLYSDQFDRILTSWNMQFTKGVGHFPDHTSIDGLLVHMFMWYTVMVMWFYIALHQSYGLFRALYIQIHTGAA